MFDQMIDGVRKASESSLQMQQEMFKHWTRLFSGQAQEAGAQAADWGRGSQKRWVELGVEMLNRHREAIDTIYKSGIQVIEQAFHVAEAKSADDYRRMIEDLWRKLFESAERAVREPVPRLPDVLREVGRAGSRCSRLALQWFDWWRRAAALSWRHADALRGARQSAARCAAPGWLIAVRSQRNT